MANGMKTYEPVSTVAMLNAFDAARTQCQTVQNKVDGAMAMLRGAYKADASTIYQGNMEKWVSGFHQVLQALERLNEGMGKYRQTAEAVKQNTEVTAGSWARG